MRGWQFLMLALLFYGLLYFLGGCLSITFSYLWSLRSKSQLSENFGSFEPGTAGREAPSLPLCYAVPQPHGRMVFST